jgi:WD40 repeat protein
VATLRGHTGEIRALSYTSDSAMLVSGGFDGMIGIWSIEKKAQTKSYQLADCWINCLAFLEKGKKLVIGGGGSKQDSLLSIIDSENGKQLLSLDHHKGYVVSLSVAPNEDLVASAGWDKRICVWQWPGGKLMNALKMEKEQVSVVTFVQDGKRLAIGTDRWQGRARVIIWDYITNTIVDDMSVAAESVSALLTSSDKDLMAIGCSDGTVRVVRLGAIKNR